MEIKIDTKKDSHDDIKKIIAFLQKFIEENNNYNYESNNSNNNFNIPATNMFDSPSSIPENKKEDSEDDVRIIEY